MTEPQTNDLPFSIERVNVSSEGKRKLIGEWKIELPEELQVSYEEALVEENEQLIRDDLIAELKEQHNEQMNAILIHPDAYHKLTEATDNSFFGKIKYGWRLFALSVSDWKDAMVSEDYVEEFFEYLGNRGEL